MSDRKPRLGGQSVSRVFDNRFTQERMGGPLLLVDPDAGFDYGAGELTTRGVRKLLLRNREGRPLYLRERLGIGDLIEVASYDTFVAAAIAGGALLLLGSMLMSLVISGSWLWLPLLIAVGAGYSIWARWANRRIEPLHTVLGKLTVPIPQPPEHKKGGAEDTGEEKVQRRFFNAVAGLRLELNQADMNLWSDGQSGGLRRVIRRSERAALNAEVDQLLYSAARALDENSPELAEAVITGADALVMRIRQARTRTGPAAPAIEVPGPQRSIAELTQQIAAPLEPEHVEYDAHPTMVAYPHAPKASFAARDGICPPPG